MGRLVRGEQEGVGSWKMATEGSGFGEFPRSGVLPSRHFHFNRASVLLAGVAAWGGAHPCQAVARSGQVVAFGAFQECPEEH